MALRVAILGAGASGLCLGVKLREAGIRDFTIFEKSDDVGGTWHDNVYPGACCDVLSNVLEEVPGIFTARELERIRDAVDEVCDGQNPVIVRIEGVMAGRPRVTRNR